MNVDWQPTLVGELIERLGAVVGGADVKKIYEPPPIF